MKAGGGVMGWGIGCGTGSERQRGWSPWSHCEWGVGGGGVGGGGVRGRGG